MKKPSPLGERELALIELYADCQLGMTPQKFRSKWDVNYEQLGDICYRSVSTVRRWFGRGQNYQAPEAFDLRNLALMDLLLEHYEEIPSELLNLLCPSQRQP